MTLDEIRHQLSTAHDIPEAALTAAVEQAEVLVPDVLRLVELAAKHIMLTRREERLLFYGVHVLAAAKRTELYDALLRLIAERSYDIEWLLNDAPLHALLISSHAAGNKIPYELLAHPEIHGEAKSDLFLLAAWLVWQGYAPREEFVDFLRRFDGDEFLDPDDSAWFGWQGAIALLGLTELEERVRAGWEAGRMRFDRDVDRERWIADLYKAARDPANGTAFSSLSAEPIGDVLVALRRIAFFGFGRIAYADEPDPADPARNIRLLTDEQQWLESFLAHESAPPAAMTLECIDGFFTALAAGPQEVPIDVWWPRIWGEEDELPQFETDAQEPYLRELLGRYLETIQRRLGAGYRHIPLVEEDSPDEFTSEWAIGFSIGADLLPQTWSRIAEHRDAGFAVAAITILMPEGQLDEEVAWKVPRDEESRLAVLRKLPDLIRGIYAFWHGQPMQPLFGPRRSQKIGRNEPCPCGSGRKYKKCCGANPPS